MIDKCVFCNYLLAQNKQSVICSACKVIYRIDLVKKQFINWFFIHKYNNCKYVIEYNLPYLLIRHRKYNFHINQTLLKIELKDSQYPITPENCTQKLSYYLTFS